LFRIDRRLVNLAGTKFIKLHKNSESDDEDSEVDAAGEFPDAETSIAAMEAAMEATARELLSEAEAEAKEKAGQILDEAHNEVAQILLDAREESEELHRRAWQEGFTEGSEEGRHSYDEQLAEKIREDDEMLKRVIDEIHKEREQTYSEIEEQVTDLALEIVKKIINPAEEALGDVFLSLIKNALKQMSTDNKIILRVSPAEYERFFSSGAATIELDSGVIVSATVLRDVSLNEGDCIIDTDDVTVNAGIDSQLQYVKLAFERANQYEPD